MQIASRTYSPAEAAALSGVAIKAVHNAIDRHIILAVEEKDSARKLARRRIGGDGLLRLKLWYGVGATLSAARRQRLFDEIDRSPTAQSVRADDLLIVDVAEARRQIETNVARLDEAEADIHSDKGIMGGEPVFKGTRIPARLVAAMLDQGGDPQEILDGYPSLTARRLELAPIWAAAHPAIGRPQKLTDGLRLKSVTHFPLDLSSWRREIPHR